MGWTRRPAPHKRAFRERKKREYPPQTYRPSVCHHNGANRTIFQKGANRTTSSKAWCVRELPAFPSVYKSNEQWTSNAQWCSLADKNACSSKVFRHPAGVFSKQTTGTDRRGGGRSRLVQAVVCICKTYLHITPTLNTRPTFAGVTQVHSLSLDSLPLPEFGVAPPRALANSSLRCSRLR